MRERLAKGLFSLADGLHARGASAARGGNALKWAARESNAVGTSLGNRNSFNTIAGAAAGGAYGAFSDDTSVLGGMAMGAVAGRYGGQAIRSGRGAMGALRSGVGAMGPVVPSSLGKAFGQSVMYGGGSSARLIGNDITKAYNGFKGLFKGGKGAAPPTSVGSAVSKSRTWWKDPNTAVSVVGQRRLKAMTPQIVKSARRGAAAFKAQGQAARMSNLASRAAGIPNRAGTVKQSDNLYSLAARDTAMFR